jgi:hypothetical protein
MKKLFVNPKIHPVALALIFLLSHCLSLKAQEQVLEYKVVQGGDELGRLKLSRKVTGNIVIIRSTTEVKKRFIFLFTLSERQEAIFQNGRLTKSYFFRKQNNTVKADKQASYTGSCYEVRKDSSTEKVLMAAASDNLQSIYFHEPDHISQIYSDNYQCMVDIRNTGDRQYTIKIPGSSTNYYSYDNGICTKVKIEHTLFTVELILITPNL